MAGGFVSPVDFWSLPPGQAWWIVYDNQPEKPPETTNYAQLRHMVKTAKEQEAKAHE